MASKVQFLKKSSEYNHLKENGQKFWAAPWLLINYSRLKDSDEVKVGITASRFVGPAVVRNRLKRWVRQYFREARLENRSYGLECNFIFKTNSKDFFRELKYSEFEKSADKFIQTVFK